MNIIGNYIKLEHGGIEIDVEEDFNNKSWSELCEYLKSIGVDL